MPLFKELTGSEANPPVHDSFKILDIMWSKSYVLTRSDSSYDWIDVELGKGGTVI